MGLIRTRMLNTWLGTQVDPEKVMADPQRYDEMVTAIEAMMQLQEIRKRQQRREQQVRSWFEQQVKAHPTYLSYRQ